MSRSRDDLFQAVRPAALLGVAVLLLFSAPASEAVAPRTWRTTGVDGWTAAERESVGVTSDGELALALTRSPAADLEAGSIWDLLEDGKDVLAATGDPGTVVRVAPDGAVSELARVIQPEVTALGRDDRGRVLFGAAPDGVIYRLDSSGPVLVADTPELYVWRILTTGRGTFIATGNTGRVYRLGRNGQPELFANVGAVNVTGLEADGDDLIATTESPGRLLRIAPDGTWTVLYDADEPELRSPQVGDDGAILFLADPEAGSGRVLRWRPGGAVEEIWSAPSGFLYRLVSGGSGRLWVTTGEENGNGSVIELEPGPPTAWVERLQVEEPQILTALWTRGGGRWIGTGGAGRVYRILEGRAVSGIATGPVEDAGGQARWGALMAEPGLPPGPFRVQTRSGNTKTPDDRWSDWEAVRLEADRGPVPSPPARFLQWRVRLEGESARVGGIRVTYLPTNLAPRVSAARVSALGEELKQSWDRGQPASMFQELPGGVRVEFQTPGNRNGTSEAGDAEASWARRYRTVSWDSTDPNGDDLRFDIDLRAAGETVWKPLVRDREASPWVWDSSTVPDGWYALRVRASDRADNPPGGELTGFRVTDAFLVDNTPPRVSDLQVRNGAVTGVAEDAGSSIKRLELAVDGASWTTLFPEDGIPDMPREPFRTSLKDLSDDLASGDHVIVIRVFDQAGNPGTGRVSFKTP